MSKILKNVNFLLLSPFDTFGEFPAVFGNSQDESKFVIPEWRRNILVASEGPLLQTLKRQICKEEEEEEMYNMVGNGALMNSGSKPIPHAPMLLQSSSSAAIFPYFKYFNPRKFISNSFSKRFLNIRISLLRFNLPGKWPPIVSALKALLHKKWYLFRLKQLSRCLVYNAIVFINVGQMMMVGSSSWLNTPWPLQYFPQIERWFSWTLT